MNTADKYRSTEQRIRERNRLQNKLMFKNLFGGLAILMILIFIAGLFLGDQVEAAEVEVPDKFWLTPITYYDHGTCTDVVEEYSYAASQEASFYSGVPIKRLGTVAGYDHDGRNSVGCAYDSPFFSAIMGPVEDGLYYEDEHFTQYVDGKLFTLGTARTWFYQSGQIIEMDIWLNSLWMSIESTAKTVTKHEWAHGLGVPHSEFSESLMAPADGAADWDIETIAKLSMTYKECTLHVDGDYNLFVPKLPLVDPETGTVRDVYGIIPAGHIWPNDVSVYGDSRCID